MTNMVPRVRAIATILLLTITVAVIALVADTHNGRLGSQAPQGTMCKQITQHTAGKTIVNLRICFPDFPGQ
jgi:hypothetical protein